MVETQNDIVAEIHSPIQERSVPEYNILEQRFKKLWYLLSTVTHPSKVQAPNEPREIERSLLGRAVRAELLQKFFALPKSDTERRKQILDEAHIRDEIAHRYLNQGEISVDLPELGRQTSRLLALEPPESQTTPETQDKPPIFFIPGISADIDPVGGLVQELAFMGRKIVVIGYPEASLGKVTPEFARKAAITPNFEPHTTFFKQAIKKLAGEADIELWSYSTGGPIVAEILADPEFQERVSNAVFLAPASCVNQSKLELATGLANEIFAFTRKLKKLPSYSLSSYSLVLGRKTPDLPYQSKNKATVFTAQIDKVCRKSASWERMRVKPGGRIVVWNGEDDRLTTSYKLEKDIQNNPQVLSIKDKKGLHVTPVLEPKRILRDIFTTQQAQAAS